MAFNQVNTVEPETAFTRKSRGVNVVEAEI